MRAGHSHCGHGHRGRGRENAELQFLESGGEIKTRGNKSGPDGQSRVRPVGMMFKPETQPPVFPRSLPHL